VVVQFKVQAAETVKIFSYGFIPFLIFIQYFKIIFNQIVQHLSSLTS